MPFGDVVRKRRPAHGGIVPQKAVAERRDEEGHAHLRVALGEFERAAFQIEPRLLILPHAEELFVARLKAERKGVVSAADGTVLARHHPQRGRVRHIVFVTAVIFFQNEFAVAEKAHFAEAVDGDFQPPVGKFRAIFFHRDDGRRLLRARERPIDGIVRGVHGGLHADPVLPLRIDAHRLPSAREIQSSRFYGKHIFSLRFVRLYGLLS